MTAMLILCKRQLSNALINEQIHLSKNYITHLLFSRIIKTKMATISHAYGLELSDQGVVELGKQAFASVDFELYPPQREHFLIHALQFQHKLPKESSMRRCEIRNQRKSGVEEANKKVGRPTRVITNPRRVRRGFAVPEKVLPKPDRRRGRWLYYGGRGAVKPNRKVALKPAKKAKVFKISSPERVALKCARAACKVNLQKWRKEHPPKIESEVDVTPIYFQKKKASQKRRRLEKHNLIKKNRRALIEIYGAAIFQRGWPVSRKEIKAALGIKQQDTLAQNVAGLADLVKE